MRQEKKLTSELLNAVSIFRDSILGRDFTNDQPGYDKACDDLAGWQAAQSVMDGNLHTQFAKICNALAFDVLERAELILSDAQPKPKPEPASTVSPKAYPTGDAALSERQAYADGYATDADEFHIFNPDHNLFCIECGKGEIEGPHGITHLVDGKQQYVSKAVAAEYSNQAKLQDEQPAPSKVVRTFLESIKSLCAFPHNRECDELANDVETIDALVSAALNHLQDGE